MAGRQYPIEQYKNMWLGDNIEQYETQYAQ